MKLRMVLVFLVYVGSDFGQVYGQSRLDPSTRVLVGQPKASSPSQKPTSQNLFEAERYRTQDTRTSPPQRTSGSTSNEPKTDEMARQAQKPGDQEKLGSQDRIGETTFPTQAESALPEKPEPAKKQQRGHASPTERAKSFAASLLGGSSAQIETYVRKLDRGDLRRRLVELDFGTIYSQTSASSTYPYRDWQAQGARLSLQGYFWLSPFFAFSGSYSSSLNQHMTDTLTPSRSISTTFEDYSIGFVRRRFESLNPNSPYLVYGIDYRELLVRVPQAAPSRSRLKTTGLGLTVRGHFFRQRDYEWMLGFSLRPLQRHYEQSTALEIQSGAEVISHGIGAALGQLFRIDGQRQVYWRWRWEYFKHMYTGTASQPYSGTSYHDVAVENTTQFFEVGLRWGASTQ